MPQENRALIMECFLRSSMIIFCIGFAMEMRINDLASQLCSCSGIASTRVGDWEFNINLTNHLLPQYWWTLTHASIQLSCSIDGHRLESYTRIKGSKSLTTTEYIWSKRWSSLRWFSDLITFFSPHSDAHYVWDLSQSVPSLITERNATNTTSTCKLIQ